MRTLFKIIACIAAYVFFAYHVFAAGKDHTGFTVKVTGKGQPVILIPGATCDGTEWDATVAHLAPHFQCHVLTLAGYAGTPALAEGPYLRTYAKEIENYIRTEKLDNVILIGHSIGGVLSLMIATEMKDHIQKEVIVDAMPFFAATFNPGAKSGFSEEKAKETLATFTAMDDKAMKASQLRTAKFLCRDSTKWDMIATWGVLSDKKTFAYTITEMMSDDLRETIGAIKVPVLVLAAYCKMPEYPGFTRESVEQSYSGQYKACNSCVVHVADDNTKHFIMYDSPDWMFAEMDTFLTGKK